jgi:hypothetical protein
MVFWFLTLVLTTLRRLVLSLIQAGGSRINVILRYEGPPGLGGLAGWRVAK